MIVLSIFTVSSDNYYGNFLYTKVDNYLYEVLIL